MVRRVRTCSDPAWLLTYWALLLGSLCVYHVVMVILGDLLEIS